MVLTSSRLRQRNDSSSPSGGIQRNRNPKGILSGQLVGGAVSENRTFPNGACFGGNRVFFCCILSSVEIKHSNRSHIGFVRTRFLSHLRIARNGIYLLRYILRYVNFFFLSDRFTALELEHEFSIEF